MLENYAQNLYPTSQKTLNPDGTFTNPVAIFMQSLWNRTGKGTGVPLEVAVNLTASGSSQADALQLNVDLNLISSASEGNGVILLPLKVGQRQEVFNNSSSSLNVYPATGHQINNLGVNAPFVLVAGAIQVFTGYTPTQLQTAGNPLSQVVINPPAGPTQGLVINQVGPNSLAVTPGQFFFYNSIAITNDNVFVSPTNLSAIGLDIEMTTGANAGGSHYGLRVQVFRNATSLNPTGDTIGAEFGAVGEAPDGANGALYGMTGFAVGLPGATGYQIWSGGEFDVIGQPGSSVHNRFGMDIVGQGPVQGSDRDCAIEIGHTAGGSFNMGLMLSGLHGSNPVTGTIVGTDGSAMTVARGIDFSNVTITGQAFFSPGFQVTGAGAISANGPISAQAATAIPAGGTTGSGIMLSSTANFGIFFGSGLPTLSAGKGSLYLRSDGAVNARLYINTNGSTAWTAFNTAS